jgi:hypothetical protein
MGRWTAASPSEFAQAVAAKDWPAVRGLLDERVEIRGMTPRRFWEADSAQGAVGVIATWFGPDEVIGEVLGIDTGAFADRQRAGYLLRVRRPTGSFLIEQQACSAVAEGGICWLRIMCSGFAGRSPRACLVSFLTVVFGGDDLSCP